jgi:CBS domain-containing membrane protein
MLACLGAFIAIALTAAACGLVLGAGGWSILIVAPMGASAVLVFAVPRAQPRVKKLSRRRRRPRGGARDRCDVAQLSLHPRVARWRHRRPRRSGGGVRFLFLLVPVASLVAAGIAFHRLSGRPIPMSRQRRRLPPHGTTDGAHARAGVRSADDAALAGLHETYDIDRGDVTA